MSLNAALDRMRSARNAWESMKFSLGVARRAAAVFSLATMTAAGCSTFGTAEPSEAGPSEPDTGSMPDTSVRPFDSAVAQEGASPGDASSDADGSGACETDWVTTFETVSALNSPPWDRSMVGTSLKLAIDLADAKPGAGMLVGEFVPSVTPAAQDFLVYGRALSPAPHTRLSFDVGAIAGVGIDLDFSIAQISGLVASDGGPQSLVIRWAKGAIVATTLRGGAGGTVEVIGRFNGIRPDDMSQVVLDLVPNARIKMTVGSAPPGVLDAVATLTNAKIQIGPHFTVAAPPAGVFGVKYDNVRAEHCTVP